MKAAKKICMLGNFGVGKTSLVRRFVHQVFDDNYLSTIGVQVSQKEINLTINDNPVELKMVLSDLAHIEAFTPSIKNNFTGSSGAIVVFDLTRRATWDLKKIYLDKFVQINPEATVVFAANKSDLIEDEELPCELLEIVTRHKTELQSTSAKTGKNVEGLFDQLAKGILS